jgi:hypothetical protein
VNDCQYSGRNPLNTIPITLALTLCGYLFGQSLRGHIARDVRSAAFVAVMDSQSKGQSND